MFLQNITGFMVGRMYGAVGSLRRGEDGNGSLPTQLCPSSPSSSAGRLAPETLPGCADGHTPRASCGNVPGARISVMGAQQAASVLLTIRPWTGCTVARVSEQDQEAFRSPIVAGYEAEGSPYSRRRPHLGRRRYRPCRRSDSSWLGARGGWLCRFPIRSSASSGCDAQKALRGIRRLLIANRGEIADSDDHGHAAKRKFSPSRCIPSRIADHSTSASRARPSASDPPRPLEAI